MDNTLTSITQRAIKNNQNWCQLVANLHKIQSKQQPDVWLAIDPMPTFFPNLVTLKNTVSSNQLESLIPKQGSYFVKDCFDTLDLEPFGFIKLFDARWYVASAQTSLQSTDNTDLCEVNCAEELEEWESRWRGEENFTPIYPTPFLTEESTRFFVAQRDDKVAGITSFSDQNTLGIYNLWGEPSLFSSLISHLQTLYPGLDIVGYGDENELLQLEKIGFKPLHPLAVWGRFS